MRKKSNRFDVRLFTAAVMIMVCLLEGCTSQYPFTMMVNDKPLPSQTVVDAVNRISYRFDAQYSVGSVVSSRISLVITNNSRGVLELGSGRVRITSRNVDYEMNDRFLPLPGVDIPPHGTYELTFKGNGHREVEEPWQLIAGEQMVVTLRGLVLDGREIPGQTVHLIPVNPKL